MGPDIAPTSNPNWELGRGSWRVALGSMAGLTVGNGPIMQFTFGIFLVPVVSEFRSDRATMSLALLVGLTLTGIATPIAGYLIDRIGIRRVALPAIMFFSIGIASIGAFAHSPAGFITIYALLGIASAGQSPLPYARAVTAAFERRRGLALGVAMAGVGLGTAILPPLVQYLISQFGWRAAYELLGVIVFAIAFPAMALFVAPRRSTEQSQAANAFTGERAGMTASSITRSREFWLLAVSFLFVAIAACGVLAHLIPLLEDRGVARASAAFTISLSGLALIAGRLAAGYFLDKVFGPHVALVFFLAPLTGIGIILGSNTVTLALPAAVLVGLGLGAEIDLMAFLISRYFGMRAFGQVYGYLFAIFMLGAGLGPFLMGSAFSRMGTYSPALWMFAALLAVASALIMRLGSYRFASDVACD
jgi:MFS family permease